MQLPLVLMWLVLLCGTWASAQTGCPRNCERCVAVAGPRCESCGPGSTLSMNLRACHPCPPRCVECRATASGLQCIRCGAGDGVTPDGKCASCPVGCRRCHYDLGPHELVCDECDEQYARPGEDGACQRLQQGEYRDVIHGQLHTCPQHAQHCKDVGARHPLITRCQDGYTLHQDSHDPTLYTCVHVAGHLVQGRVSCAQGYVYIKDAHHLQAPCQECAPKKPAGSRSAYYLDAARDCKPCPHYALECYRDNEGIMHVMQCQSGYEIYYDSPDSDQECVACPAGCTECLARTLQSTTRQLRCRECRQGYYKLDGDCVLCPQHCHTCDSRGQCQQCDVTYMLADTSCVRCPDNCDVCDESGCTECGGGYARLARDDYYCMPCAEPHCARCDAWGHCQACDAGWYVKQHRCVAPPQHCAEVNLEDPESCDLCAAGYGLNHTEYPYQCYPCDDPSCCDCEFNEAHVMVNCHRCHSHEHCVDHHVCLLTCIENCALCSNHSACEECDAGYYVGDGAGCYACPKHCVTCSSTGECEECADGYYVSASGECEACVEGTKCFQCPPRHLDASSGMCRPCPIPWPANCARCGEQGCEQCEQNFALWDASNCVPCPLHCGACYVAECEEGRCVKCTQCAHAHGPVNPDSTRPAHWCAPCPPHCAACTYDRSLGDMRCKRCGDSGYYLRGGRCVRCSLRIPHCAACHDASSGTYVCDACSINYALATDVEGATECVAVTVGMACGGAAIVIPAARCELDGCVNGTSITADYKCALQCYACEEGAGRCNHGNGSTVACVTGTCSMTPGGAAGCGGDTCEQNICGNAASSTEPCCCSTNLCNVRPTSKSPAPAIHLFCFFLATALSLIG